MSKKLLFAIFVFGISFLAASTENVSAQRKSVSGKEVTGTFRYAFTGKYKGSSNEITIQALGGGKLKIGFDLTYPFIDGTGEMNANVGQAVGTATIEGDTAIYETTEDGNCKIVIKFVSPGVIKVTQEQDGAGCGFGFNVSANGTYKKVSSSKPKFPEM